jgi:hypothetical protein
MPQAADKTADKTVDTREKQRKWDARNTSKQNDIGAIPPVLNPERRAAAEASLQVFLETYFPGVFRLAWSPDHLEVIAKTEQALVEGTYFALAMPRGAGKSSIHQRAALWALLCGHCSFVMVVCADATKAIQSLASIKTELERSVILSHDFPEVCYPVRKLGGIAMKAKYQHVNGVQTSIGWTAEQVVLPTVNGSRSSGGILRVSGITAASRGAQYTREDKTGHVTEVIRPELILVDDFQTREALDIETPIPTPDGFVRIRNLRVGDIVFDETGRPCSVTGVSDIHRSRKCYRVTFDDGASVVADAGHLWATSDSKQRCNQRRKRKVLAGTFHHTVPQCQPKPYKSIRTTKEISCSLLAGNGTNNHSVRMQGVSQTPKAELPIDPYVLGIWLGDGDKRSSRITTADNEILDYALLAGYGLGKIQTIPNSLAVTVSLVGLSTQLRQAGILGDKHVPEEYFFASPSQRLELLRGLMDSDGWICKRNGRCGFSNTNRRLVDAVEMLCNSLGIKSRTRQNRKKHERFLPSWTVYFMTTKKVFRLPRKSERLPQRVRSDCRNRYIGDVEEVESRPVRCITVDSPNSMFLCGTSFMPTHNSAASPTQSTTRLQIMSGDLAGMAGPGEKLSMLATMTVVYENDAADQLLNRQLHPEWHGVRKKMVNVWPTNKELWEEYVELRRSEMQAEQDHAKSTAYYADNREEMDLGSDVSWPERHRDTELSAIQHAFNLQMLDADAFQSEYQNEPVSQIADDLSFLNTVGIFSKMNGLEHGEVLSDVEKITCAIDVQGSSLWWVIVAWTEGFNGQILDYGVFPKQGGRAYTLRTLMRTFETVYPGYSEEESIYKALTELGEILANRRWKRDDGAELSISRGFVDEGYKDKTVHLFCRQNRSKNIWMPCKGMGINAGKTPMNDWPSKRGTRIGDNWRVSLGVNDRSVRHCLIDANWWKTFIQERWAVPMGGHGCLSLWGEKLGYHRLIAEHMTNESHAVTEGHGRRVVEWSLKPAKPDQHWFDCLVYCAAAANEQGITLMSEPEKKVRRRGKYESVADRRRRKSS